MTRMLELSDQEFKAIMINMLMDKVDSRQEQWAVYIEEAMLELEILTERIPLIDLLDCYGKNLSLKSYQ